MKTTSTSVIAKDRATVITGGAGFIGTNLADRLLEDGERVVIFDNLSRIGVEHNFRWLQARHGKQIRLVTRDIRDAAAVRAAIQQAASVFHFAAQVAVTSSLDDPQVDFEVNALGTLNVLEALRTTNPSAPLVFTSTNKVYGCLERLSLEMQDERYEPADERFRDYGIDESAPLAFTTPYGCSKGAADQYVLDYACSFGLPSIVFRMSCIYGPRQMGTEDQGWVAHFLRQAISGEPITIYGDGRQVRDLLFVDDLVEALLLARSHSAVLAGEAFNIGGGPRNVASVREILRIIAELEEREPECRSDAWRRGDQRYYVSDCSKFRNATGWKASVPFREGLRRLHSWLHHDQLFAKPQTMAA